MSNLAQIATVELRPVDGQTLEIVFSLYYR